MSGEKVNRRTAIKVIAGTVVGLAVGTAIGWYAKPVPPPPVAPVTLFVSCGAGARHEFPLKAMAEEYIKRNPHVRIVLDPAPFAEQTRKLHIELAAKSGQYDIFQLNYKFLGSYLAGEQVVKIPIEPAYADDLKADVPASVWKMYVRGDTWWGIPYDCNCQIHYYRKDLLDKAGLKPATTWADVLKIAKQFHNPPEMYGWVGTLGRFWTTDSWLAPFWTFGGSFFKKHTDLYGDPEDATPTINSEAGYKAAELIVELATKYGPPVTFPFGEDSVYGVFGTTGKVVQAPALWGGNVLTNPKLSKFADVTETDLVPADEKQPTKRACAMGGFGLGIAAPGKNVGEAYKFIKFVTAKENHRLVVSSTGQPGRTSALTDPENIKVAKYFKGLSGNLPFAIVRPAIPEYSEIQDIIGVEIDKAITGEQPAKTAIDIANKKIYDLFVKTGRIK